MLNILKYLNKFFRKIDISPVSSGNRFKIFLYLFAGTGLIIFTGKSSDTRDYFYKDQNGQTIYSTTEKVSSDAFILEKFELINPTGFIIFSSDFNLIFFQNIFEFPTGRSPPLRTV